jgi:formate dehydrogenase gamma subunit
MPLKAWLEPRWKAWGSEPIYTPQRLPPISVLVIDDDPKVLSRVQEVLARAGCLVDTAPSGAEGLTRLARQDYDLVFTDLMMPEMDGLEVVEQALALRPETAVLMITGFASVETAVGALKLGALDYIEKPFTPSELEAFTQAALVKKRAREIAREEQQGFVRLNLAERAQHLILLVSFTLLVITGFPLLLPDLFKNTFVLAESSLIRGITHRVAALILIGAGLYHVAYSLISSEGNRDFRKILPMPRDLIDFYHQVRYNLGRRQEPPRTGKFNLMQKLEYFGVVWGTAIMALTGFMLWFENQTLSLFPLWVLDTARIVHRYEAILAAATVFISHIYHVHFRPDLFPMSKVWLTGRVSRNEMLEEYPVEYEEVTGHPAQADPVIPWPQPRPTPPAEVKP